MRVAITGATGFVGQCLMKHLVAGGHEIRLLSRHPVEYRDCVVCELETGNIPPEAVENVDTIFHVAGYAHDPHEASKEADLCWSANVDATTNLAQRAVQSGVRQFVFVSSVKAGGPAPTGICRSEDNQAEPDGIYGQSKRTAEQKLLEISRQSNMIVSIVRPSPVYGQNMKGNLRLMLTGIKQGWFPPLPETGNRRSMIHVDDLARVLLFLANDKRSDGEIFIATDDRRYSSREIYDALCHAVGKSPRRWSMPPWVFNMAARTLPRFAPKIDELFGDACYSSEKLRALGFKANRTLSQVNESDY